MVGISTYGLQIIRAPDVIFLWPKWQLRCSNAGEEKGREREKESDKGCKGGGGNRLGRMDDAVLAAGVDASSGFAHWLLSGNW